MEKGLIHGKYKIKSEIGKGSFGKICSGEQITTHQQVAIKFEPKDSDNPQLFYECRILRCLNGALGFPGIHWYGDFGNSKVLVMDLLDISLSNLHAQYNNHFSLKTVLIIADQLINRIEFIHKKGFIHGDIKPENAILGRGYNSDVIYLIDFGLSKRYVDFKNNHIKYGENKKITGTARYLSINGHLGLEQSRRDDLESLAYVLIYLLKGELPWMTSKISKKKAKQFKNAEEKYNMIAKIKISSPIEEICSGIPSEFSTFLQQVRSLRFEDEPDYAFYKKLFRSLFLKEHFLFDNQYDWNS